MEDVCLVIPIMLTYSTEKEDEWGDEQDEPAVP
jgi:hypothetical protein